MANDVRTMRFNPNGFRCLDMTSYYMDVILTDGNGKYADEQLSWMEPVRNLSIQMTCAPGLKPFLTLQYDTRITNSRDADRVCKMFKSIEKAYEKMCAELGTPSSASESAVRYAKALGCKRTMVQNASSARDCFANEGLDTLRYKLNEIETIHLQTLVKS
jgi:hypothetical protein